MDNQEQQLAKGMQDKVNHGVSFKVFISVLVLLFISIGLNFWITFEYLENKSEKDSSTDEVQDLVYDPVVEKLSEEQEVAMLKEFQNKYNRVDSEGKVELTSLEYFSADKVYGDVGGFHLEDDEYVGDSGSAFFAYFDGAKWVTVWEGNGDTPCVDQEQFPIKYRANCSLHEDKAGWVTSVDYGNYPVGSGVKIEF